MGSRSQRLKVELVGGAFDGETFLHEFDEDVEDEVFMKYNSQGAPSAYVFADLDEEAEVDDPDVFFVWDPYQS